MHKNTILKPALVLTTIGVSILLISNLQNTRSANLTNVAATLSNSRPSFSGELAAGNTVGSSNVILDTTYDIGSPSTSAAQLVEGDVVRIGPGTTMGSYTVGPTTTNTSSVFAITTALGSGNATAGDAVIATSSSSLTVKLTTVRAITNGKFRILVPALADNTMAADGLPDGGYFDFSTAGATITCPANVAGYTFGTATATASNVTIDGNDYHEFECPYTGTGTVGQSFATTNNMFVVNGLINPAPKSNHILGTADTYRVIVQNTSSDETTYVDSTPIAIGLVEAVRVTASVSPQIAFSIFGVNSGTSACGTTTAAGINTTSTLVPFGELAISSFTTLAQTLAVSTNAANGFAVTAKANDQLGRNGGVCTGDPIGNTDCIQDSTGNNGTMSHTTSDEWSSTNYKGFAFSLHDSGSTTTEAFAYNESGRTFSARQFADAENSQDPQQIFSAAAPADNDWLYVCYRAVIPATQAAGNYENHLTYTATATF